MQWRMALIDDGLVLISEDPSGSDSGAQCRLYVECEAAALGSRVAAREIHKTGMWPVRSLSVFLSKFWQDSVSFPDSCPELSPFILLLVWGGWPAAGMTEPTKEPAVVILREGSVTEIKSFLPFVIGKKIRPWHSRDKTYSSKRKKSTFRIFLQEEN